MAEEQYIPRRATKEYDIPTPETLSPFRSPAPFQQVFNDDIGGGEGECNDGVDGQDGAQTDCSGDCHAYFA